MQGRKKKNLEVCFSPALFHLYERQEVITVVADIFRATTAICTAFDHGVKRIIPVTSVENARAYKDQGFLIAAERDGIKLDFADFGNSPYNFMQEDLDGTTIVYSTTNGTQAIHRAASTHMVIIASFINLSAIADFLNHQAQDVVILCAGWKDRFSLEDAVFSGALAEKLLQSGDFDSACDSVTAAIDLWETASADLMAYNQKFAHTHRLKSLMLDDVIEFCLTPDQSSKVPIFQQGEIMNHEDLILP
ncbi:MAG: 2-phosphosulfolactate phosphatase [Bacteroidales bacterium]